MPNFTFYGEHKSDNELPFLFLNLSSVSKKSTPGTEIRLHSTFSVGINATKFEKTPIHFISDVFAAIAVVDA